MSSDPAQQRQYLEAGHVLKKDWAQHRAVHLFTCRTCLDTWALAAMFGLGFSGFAGSAPRCFVTLSRWAFFDSEYFCKEQRNRMFPKNGSEAKF